MRWERALTRLHVVCPYYTMFPLDFPQQALRGLPARSRVLDPFSGRGTTIFAARLLGLRAYGVDSNPVAAEVSAAQLVDRTPEEVATLCEHLLLQPSSERPPVGRFWEFCFHAQTLDAIVRLRSGLRTAHGPVAQALRAILLGVLHGPQTKGPPSYLSNQMPRTYATKPAAAVSFWMKRGLTIPRAVDVADVVRRRSAYVLGRRPPPVDGRVWRGDSRHLPALVGRQRFDAVVTSPPYFGLRTYRPDQWLRNWFLGGPPEVDYRADDQLRHQEAGFVAELAKVWRGVAQVSRPGAPLVVRFGCLPSLKRDPVAILEASLHQATPRWRIEDIREAGTAQRGRRQAVQFGRTDEDATTEIDLYARLAGKP